MTYMLIVFLCGGFFQGSRGGEGGGGQAWHELMVLSSTFNSLVIVTFNQGHIGMKQLKPMQISVIKGGLKRTIASMMNVDNFNIC